MELIVISAPQPIANESIIINNLFETGLKYFHLRMPDNDYQAVKQILNAIDSRFYSGIALHQFHEMASNYGIKRLHYTESVRNVSTPAKWESQLNDGFILTTSIHNTSILPHLAYFHYVFYGPVFNSISKPGYQSKVPDDFKLGKTNVKPKVIALGGVEADNLIMVKKMGFDGAAVLGSIWSDPDKAVVRFKQLKEKLAALIQQNQ